MRRWRTRTRRRPRFGAACEPHAEVGVKRCRRCQTSLAQSSARGPDGQGHDRDQHDVPAVAISTPGSAVRNSHTCASSELPVVDRVADRDQHDVQHHHQNEASRQAMSAGQQVMPPGPLHPGDRATSSTWSNIRSEASSPASRPNVLRRSPRRRGVGCHGCAAIGRPRPPGCDRRGADQVNPSPPTEPRSADESGPGAVVRSAGREQNRWRRSGELSFRSGCPRAS